METKEELTTERKYALGIPYRDLIPEQKIKTIDPGDIEEEQYKKDMAQLITREEHNQKIDNLNNNINQLNKCLKDKDYRLKKVEGRWHTFIWCWIIIGIILANILLLLGILTIHSNLPQTIYDPGLTIPYVVTDWYLLISSIIIDILAFAGLWAIIILLFMVFSNDEEK